MCARLRFILTSSATVRVTFAPSSGNTYAPRALYVLGLAHQQLAG